MAVVLIVLKVILWILLAILGIIVLACILPVSGKVSYMEGKFSYKAAYSYVNLIDSQGGGLINRLRKRKKKPKKDDDENISYDTETEEVPEMSEHSDIQGNQNEDISEEITDEVNAEISGDSAETEYPEDYGDEDEDIPDFEEDEEFEDDERDNSSLGDKLEFLISIWEAAERPVLKIFKGFHLNDIYIDFIIADEDAYKCAVNYGIISGAVYNLLAWLGALFTIQFKTVDINAGFALKESRWDTSAKIKFRLGTLVIAGIWFLITYLFKIFIPNKISAKKAAAETAE